MCDIFVNLPAADAPIVTPIVDRFLVSAIAGINRSLMNTAVAAAVRVVVFVVNLEDFKSRPGFLMGFGELGKKRTLVL